MLPRPLDSTELRVLGALLEKSQTTPDYYPMTVNALIAACNQKSNREPVTSMGETEVYEALSRLRQDVLVWNSEGARTERWQENLSERLKLKGPARALMTVMILRGPQTPGELRSRTGRMYPFDGLAEIEEVLRELASLDEPLVAMLPRQVGKKEHRWAHLLGEEPPTVEGVTIDETSTTAAPLPTTGGPSLAQRVARLEERVAQLDELIRRIPGVSDVEDLRAPEPSPSPGADHDPSR